MFVIRKTSPWQDQSILYPNGNPAVGLFNDLEEAIQQKNEWEIELLKQNGITNSYEYWDVDCTKELLKLDYYLIETHGIRILNEDRNEEYLQLSDIIPSMFPTNFSNQDFWSVQKIMNRYYYKVEEHDQSDKYIIIFSNNIIGWLNDESNLSSSINFELYESKNEAVNEVKKSTVVNFNRWSKGTYNLVGPILRKDFSQKTNLLLAKFQEIVYDDESHATGQQFKSEKNLDEIENGFEKLIEILDSVDKNIFIIRQLK